MKTIRKKLEDFSRWWGWDTGPKLHFYRDSLDKIGHEIDIIFRYNDVFSSPNDIYLFSPDDIQRYKYGKNSVLIMTADEAVQYSDEIYPIRHDFDHVVVVGFIEENLSKDDIRKIAKIGGASGLE